MYVFILVFIQFFSFQAVPDLRGAPFINKIPTYLQLNRVLVESQLKTIQITCVSACYINVCVYFC